MPAADALAELRLLRKFETLRHVNLSLQLVDFRYYPLFLFFSKPLKINVFLLACSLLLSGYLLMSP
jgi:hypothetical protein